MLSRLDLTEAAPAFMTIIGMPFTSNIAYGFIGGFITWFITKFFTYQVLHWPREPSYVPPPCICRGACVASNDGAPLCRRWLLAVEVKLSDALLLRLRADAPVAAEVARLCPLQAHVGAQEHADPYPRLVSLRALVLQPELGCYLLTQWGWQ